MLVNAVHESIYASNTLLDTCLSGRLDSKKKVQVLTLAQHVYLKVHASLLSVHVKVEYIKTNRGFTCYTSKGNPENATAYV